MPVVLYNIPKYMHFSLPPALVAELATHENVIGIKDSSGNRELLAAYLKSQSPTLRACSPGNAPMFHHALSAGARGRHSRGGAVRGRRCRSTSSTRSAAATTPRPRRRRRA